MTTQVYTLVCFGDSVTKGAPYVAAPDCFPQLLKRRVNQRLIGTGVRFRCFNAGVGSENTADGIARIQGDVLDRSADLVAVEFGLNDIRYEPEKRISQGQFAENLKEIARRIRDAGAGVILMTPNPIVDSWHIYYKMPYYDAWGGCNGAVAEYADIIRRVAEEIEAPLCDIYARFVGLAVDAEFRGETRDHRDLTSLGRYISVTDGVHPTAEGHEIIAQELYRLVANLLPYPS